MGITHDLNAKMGTSMYLKMRLKNGFGILAILFNALILTFVLGHKASAGDAVCSTGEIRYKYFGELKLEKAQYCYNDSKTELQSQSCFEGKCQLIEDFKVKTREVDYYSLGSQYGTPGFKLCKIIGGLPQVVEFRVSGEWFALDRCLQGSDKSFIDTGLLLNLLKEQSR